jgi:hypothetical protein
MMTSCKKIDVIRKAMAAIFVYLLNIASIVLPLFLPKKDSAPPDTIPDIPCVFADCKSTIIIMDTQKSKCMIVSNTFKNPITTPPDFAKVILTYIL